MPIATDSQSTNAFGGTEAMKNKLAASIPPELLDNFQIFVSRVEQPLDPSKIRIYYAHDLAGDPAADAALINDGWKNFHLCVFVSNWQMQKFIERYQIPWSRCIVMLNAIEPIEEHEKPQGPLRLAYWSTPHRGLNILLPVFNALCREFPDLHLDVFSSYKLYGWEQRDAEYEQLFDACRNHPNITYHGTQSNDVIRESLKSTHIMAYPSTWMETSCICLMEAMSAGVIPVIPNLGALYETSANWATMYQWLEDFNEHASMFFYALRETILDYDNKKMTAKSMRSYANVFYNWNVRKHQWQDLLTNLVQVVNDRSLPQKMFSYAS